MGDNAALDAPMRNTVIQYRGFIGSIPKENEFKQSSTMTKAAYAALVQKPSGLQTGGATEIDQAFAVADAATADRGLGTYYKLSASEPAPCFVTKSYFKYISRQCSTPYDTSALPPQVTNRCAVTQQCQWSVVEYPCVSPTGGWTAANTPTLSKRVCDTKMVASKDQLGNKNYCESAKSTNCQAEFKCRAPGTYTLMLRVDDGCSVVEEKTTVTCKCQNVLKPNLDGPQIVQYQCDQADQQYKFAVKTLTGKFTVNTPRGGGGSLDMKCPAPKAAAATPTPPVAPGACCPSPAPCPKCNQCPSCTCSAPAGRGSAPAPSSSFPASRRSSMAKQAFVSKKEETADESLDIMLGTAVPIAVVTVISLIANIVLFKIYQSEE